MSPGTALPTTPEVNEDITRSTTPEVISSVHHNSTGIICELIYFEHKITGSNLHFSYINNYN